MGATTPGAAFVEPADRIATFDNDGTLWVEQPLPPQFDFVSVPGRRKRRPIPRSRRGSRTTSPPLRTVVDKRGHVLDPGPRPSDDSETPQMVVLAYGYSSEGASDPGRITISLSIAAGSRTPLVLGNPLGGRGPSVEIQGPDGMVAAAYGMPVELESEPPGGALEAGSAPLNFEVVIPAAAMCPGHSLRDAVKYSTAPGEGTPTLTVGVRDPAIGRHRAAHGLDASSDLLVVAWPPKAVRPAP